MPAVEVGPAKPGTYRFVLRRYDYDPQFPLPFNGYDEVKQPRDVTFQGRRGLTIFLAQPHSRDLATKEGWLDETQDWFAGLEADARVAAAEADEPAPVVPLAPVVAPAPDPVTSAERKRTAVAAKK